MSSCFGIEMPASDWIVLKICFRFADDFCCEVPMVCTLSNSKEKAHFYGYGLD